MKTASLKNVLGFGVCSFYFALGKTERRKSNKNKQDNEALGGFSSELLEIKEESLERSSLTFFFHAKSSCTFGAKF